MAHCQLASQLPGYFRPHKSWDLVAISNGRLIAAIELKSQVGSIGNNFNNRTEEVLGSGVDLHTAIEESVHMIALSILSGSHLSLTEETIKLLKKNKISNIPLVIGGIIPVEDEKKMLKLGVSRIYTPKNYDVNSIMLDFANILEKHYL